MHFLFNLVYFEHVDTKKKKKEKKKEREKTIIRKNVKTCASQRQMKEWEESERNKTKQNKKAESNKTK